MKVNEQIREIEQKISDLQKQLVDEHEWQALSLAQHAQNLLYEARAKTTSEQVELARAMKWE